MRNNIVHIGAGELTYEIREIVEAGRELEKKGIPMRWENIGDPVAKGVTIPEWIKNIVSDIITNDDSSYGYSPTKGLLEARQFISDLRKRQSGVMLDPEDILFSTVSVMPFPSSIPISTEDQESLGPIRRTRHTLRLKALTRVPATSPIG